MTPDLILYRYLVTRNFCRVLKSPALILFALKSYQQIEQEYLSEENPAKTLHQLQTMYNDKTLQFDRKHEKGLVLESIEDMPEYKKAYFTAIIDSLCSVVIIDYLLIGEGLEDSEQIEIQEISEAHLKELQEILYKEALKIQDKTDFDFDESVPVDYKLEKDIFESQYFKLSLLENIYIYILKFIHYVSSCCRQTNNKVAPSS